MFSLPVRIGIATANLADIVFQTGDLKRAKMILADAGKILHREKVSNYLGKLRAKFEETE